MRSRGNVPLRIGDVLHILLVFRMGTIAATYTARLSTEHLRLVHHALHFTSPLQLNLEYRICALLLFTFPYSIARALIVSD